MQEDNGAPRRFRPGMILALVAASWLVLGLITWLAILAVEQ